MVIMNKSENEWTLWVLADEFFFAAKELEKSFNPDKTTMASYYLCAHSLELAFKCFLNKNGISLHDLKKEIGHDLEKALKKAKQIGFGTFVCIDSGYEKVVKGLNKYYVTKELEYMTSREKVFPRLADVKDVVEKTLNALFCILSDHL